MQISNKIDNLLKERKINFNDLAKHVGMSRQGLRSSITNDILKVSTLESIADFFKVDITYFFTDTIKSKQTSDIDKVFDILKDFVKSKIK